MKEDVVSRDAWWADKALVVYMLIACVITWLCWGVAILVSNRQGYLLPAQDAYLALAREGFADPLHALIAFIFVLGGFGPLVGALLATRLESGAEGVTALWRQITRARIGGRWYAIAALLALAMAGGPLLAGVLTGQFAAGGLLALAPFFLPLLVWEIVISLGEEPGWRGFLLPRLQARMSGDRYIWVLGALWAVWHYPYVIYHELAAMPTMPPPAMLIGVIVALAGYTITLIAYTYLYVWLYNHTKSVFLAILFHAFLNMAALIAFSAVREADSLLIMVTALTPWAIVLLLGRVLGDQKFPGQPETL